MTVADLKERLKAGVWKDNPGLVQLLGLCPLLAVTTTLVNGVGLGIATLLVLTFSRSIDDLGQRYNDAAFKRAFITFAIARGLNGLISVAQGTEVALQPAGLGLVFAPGQIFDPINDSTQIHFLQNKFLDLQPHLGLILTSITPRIRHQGGRGGHLCAAFLPFCDICHSAQRP